MKFINKFKEKWEIKSNFQLLLIFIVFSITGSSALYVRKFIFQFIGVTDSTPLYFKVPLYILTVVPAYQILLLIWGAIFGQFRFFFNFQKKSFSRFKRKKNTTN